MRYRAVQPCIVVDVPHDTSQPVQWVRPVSPVASWTEFVTWLETYNNKDDSWDELVSHLRNVVSDTLEGCLDWSEPWTALADLGTVYCRLGIHREETLQADFRRALGALYADSFS